MSDTTVKTHRVGIIMNGVTGRMGTNQHLLRSIAAIRKEGGIPAGNDEVILPEAVLVGRNPEKLKKCAELSGIDNISTDLNACLADPAYPLYFDAQTTDRRAEAVRLALEAGKHVYCEKPVACTSAEALDLHHLAEEKGLKTGVVQDKLWLPGLLKLRKLIDDGFFGRILSVRGEFGYWVFEGNTVPAQRPSWNYRKKDGGGMILDMYAHYRYVIDNLFGEVSSLVCLGANHIPERWDEEGKPYNADADDAVYGIMQLKSGAIVQMNSSWCTRVRRDDLFTLHVDGTGGSAVAGLRKCRIQPADGTPKPVWNPDIDNPIDFHADWKEIPGDDTYDNAFKAQWELFLRHVVLDEPFRWSLREGAKGVQLAELAYRSWEERTWVDIPELS